MMGQVTNWLDAIAHAWSDWMWDMSLHVTWLVLLLWILDRPLKRTSARLRFLLWSLVLVRLVIPPDFSLPTGLGWWCGDWFAQHTPRWTVSQAVLEQPSATALTSIDSAPTQVARAASQGQWSSFFFTLWLGFAAAQWMWLLFGWVQIRRWLALSTPLKDPSSLLALAGAQDRLGIDRPIDLHDSGHCQTPLVIGWLRPVIMLPTAIRESLTAEELESVLVHELTHVTRCDGWWRLANAMLGMLYFFHPAVWLARYKLNQLCEEACDEQTVLALSGERRNYAQAIVKAATIVGYQPPYLAMNMVGSTSLVKRRLQRILDPSFTWSAGGGWQRGLIAMLVALVLLPGGYRPSQATSPQLMGQTGLPSPSIFENRAFDSEPIVISTADPTRDAELELQAIEQLRSVDFEMRLAAYQTLEQIGTIQSLPHLEAAFLNRSGTEQDAAKRALDRIWNIIRQQTSEFTQSNRQFQNNEES